MHHKVLFMSVVVLISGCASAVDKHRILHAELTAPVDCDHADTQLHSLRKNYVSGGEQFVNGIASILPTSAILNILTGEYSSRWKLANGEFNKQIAMKIDSIKRECPGHIEHETTWEADLKS